MVESSSTKKMQAVLYTGPGQYDFFADQKDLPTPGKGEVLVRVEYAPLNPVDMHLLEGTHDHEMNHKYPYVPGSEGSGVVIANGGGFLGWRLVGKRVCFSRPEEDFTKGVISKDGTYAEYIVTPAMSCLPLDNKTSFE